MKKQERTRMIIKVVLLTVFAIFVLFFHAVTNKVVYYE